MIPREPTREELDDRREPPAGYVWRVVPAHDGWRVGGEGRQCRYVGHTPRKRCPKPAVASLLRPFGRKAPRPWHYCEDHLYGRWIEDGQVVGVRCVEVSP